MCGIVGIASRHAVSPERLASAIASLGHRGPDSHGSFISEVDKVGLGHTRLAIIDLSPLGRQPMTSSNGRYTITFNGEIYNYREIREYLVGRGCRFRSSSDTEVLLEGFALIGSAIFSMLNGIFAFAIYDHEAHQVLIARDQMGVKPLYYVHTDEGVSFASEIKALRQLAEFDLSLDTSALRRYLTFLWCPGEQTPFRAVKKLAPGTVLTIRAGDISGKWSFWNLPTYAPRRSWTYQQCARDLRDLIDQSVARQMVSDTPIGAFLSGGLDSSSVVAAMVRQATDFPCFTINSGEQEQGSTDDLPYARMVAAHLGVKLQEVRVDPHLMARRVVEMIRALDEPLADPACLNVLLISECAREQGIKVLLGGAGGDDLFTGYRRHTMLSLDPMWSLLPSWARRGAARRSNRLRPSSAFRRRLSKALGTLQSDGDERVYTSFSWAKSSTIDRLLSAECREELATDDVYEPMATLLEAHASESAVEKCLALEQRFFLADHNLLYTDKMAMSVGVEVRVPLIDLELVKFASTVPTEWKCRLFRPKSILKDSQRGILPDHIIDRPKSGFGAPLRTWLSSDLREMADDLLAENVVRARGLFDPGAVTRLRTEDASDSAYTIFSLMCIELWCRSFLDDKGDARICPKEAMSQ